MVLRRVDPGTIDPLQNRILPFYDAQPGETEMQRRMRILDKSLELAQPKTQSDESQPSRGTEGLFYQDIKSIPTPMTSVMPLSGSAKGTRDFQGPRKEGGRHAGIDIPGKVGDPIVAPINGTILRMGQDPGGYGNYLDMRGEDGTVHRMGHLNGFAPGLREGYQVREKDRIGDLGHTGNANRGFPHVHYEIFKNQNTYQQSLSAPGGSRFNTDLRIDPLQYHNVSRDQAADIARFNQNSTDLPARSAQSAQGGMDKGVYDSIFKSGPLAGQYDRVVSEAQKNNIPPNVLAGIFAHETGSGTSSMVRNRNNPGGIMDGNVGRSYPDIGAGIGEAARIAGRHYNNAGGNLAKMGSVYAPPGAANDPRGLNAGWPSGVTGFANRLAGPGTVPMEAEVKGPGPFGPPAPQVGTAEFAKPGMDDSRTPPLPEAGIGSDFGRAGATPPYTSAGVGSDFGRAQVPPVPPPPSGGGIGSDFSAFPLATRSLGDILSTTGQPGIGGEAARDFAASAAPSATIAGSPVGAAPTYGAGAELGSEGQRQMITQQEAQPTYGPGAELPAMTPQPTISDLFPGTAGSGGDMGGGIASAGGGGGGGGGSSPFNFFGGGAEGARGFKPTPHQNLVTMPSFTDPQMQMAQLGGPEPNVLPVQWRPPPPPPPPPLSPEGKPTYLQSRQRRR